MAGGIIGAGKGFAKGVELAKNSPVRHPLAMAAIVLGSTAFGGFGGTALTGGAARGGRYLTASAFYNLPPEELSAAIRDLGVSASFSAIPFGAGRFLSLSRGCRTSRSETRSIAFLGWRFPFGCS